MRVNGELSATATSGEDLIDKALENISPSDILRSVRLRSSFRSFLERGTLAECKDLFSLKLTYINTPEVHPSTSPCRALSKQRVLLPRSVPYPEQPPALSVPPRSDSNLSLVPQPLSQPGPLSRATKSHEPQSKMETASKFDEKFSACISATGMRMTKDRIELLRTAALAYTTNPVYDPDNFKPNLVLNAPILNNPQQTSRLAQLFHGQQRITEGSAIHSFFRRAMRVLMRHEIEHRASTVDKKSLSRGRGRMTVALEEISKELCVNRDTFRDETIRTKHYYTLIESCGPGDIATLGIDDNQAWERWFSASDVQFLIRFRREHFPEVEAAARGLDKSVAKWMIEVLVACGWKYEELIQCRTPLIDDLKRFVDADKLGHGKVENAIGPPSPGSAVEKRKRDFDGSVKNICSQKTYYESSDVPRSESSMGFSCAPNIPTMTGSHQAGAGSTLQERDGQCYRRICEQSVPAMQVDGALPQSHPSEYENNKRRRLEYHRCSKGLTPETPPRSVQDVSADICPLLTPNLAHTYPSYSPQCEIAGQQSSLESSAYERAQHQYERSQLVGGHLPDVPYPPGSFHISASDPFTSCDLGIPCDSNDAYYQPGLFDIHSEEPFLQVNFADNGLAPSTYQGRAV